MSESNALHKLAEKAGISIDWTSFDGKSQHVSDESLQHLLSALGLPAKTEDNIRQSMAKLDELEDSEHLPPLITGDCSAPIGTTGQFKTGQSYTLTLESGETVSGKVDSNGQLAPVESMGYHTLTLGDQSLTLAIAPQHCFTVADALAKAKPRAWGLAAQVYSLRRQGDGGIGDLKALEEFVRSAARHGADAVAISPLHAMFSADGNRHSPYSPSSRMFLNILNAAPSALLGEKAVQHALQRTGLEQEWARLEQLDLIDWPALVKTRLRLYRALHMDFRCKGGNLWEDFQAFRKKGGEALENHCRFEALHASFTHGDSAPSWQHWPEEYREPSNPAVAQFAESHAQDVEFYAFTQWLAARGLENAQKAAKEAGMHIGLIADIAVGADGGGSQAWSRQEELLSSVSVGAPPDLLNQRGQGWGISAFSPAGLKRNGFRAFIEMLQANFAYAGGVRIDHVMGLQRLWLVPEGASPEEGAYLSYPIEDMLRLVALESWRNECIVMGEDLGTVPEGFRERLTDKAIMGMQVLMFERDEDQNFKPAEEWLSTSMATTTTHDLPTMKGWWIGRDIEWQARLEQLAEDTTEEKEKQQRAQDRQRLAKTLGLQSADLDAVEDAVDGCIRHIGKSPATLTILPVEDALGLEEQANLPGTIDSHPNWRRRWPDTASTLLDNETPTRRLKLLVTARHDAESNT
ncbi:4-alpha-glucanotransferase [Pseudomonas duriflava]|uniref:4-alpha-glucanotransferase n=1 Tax=Pseudomonas duriflava TaxID=459528 RepID=A0A562Q7L1_9PSED|nr:4-alpha-glucanotransferase [Pseudomonas duriflava]TWI52737.1 4-alpha-glucanotransferase [Pseudomonas duriflava]